MGLKEIMSIDELRIENCKDTNSPDVKYIQKDGGQRIFYQRIENTNNYKQTKVNRALNVPESVGKPSNL